MREGRAERETDRQKGDSNTEKKRHTNREYEKNRERERRYDRFVITLIMIVAVVGLNYHFEPGCCLLF